MAKKSMYRKHSIDCVLSVLGRVPLNLVARVPMEFAVTTVAGDLTYYWRKYLFIPVDRELSNRELYLSGNHKQTKRQKFPIRETYQPLENVQIITPIQQCSTNALI